MAEERLDLGPGTHADLAHHRALLADEDLLLRLGLNDDVDAHDLAFQLLDNGGERVRHLLARQVQRLLAHELADLLLGRDIARLAGREVGRAFAEQRRDVVAELADAVARDRAHGMQGLELAELGGGHHLRGDVAVLQPVNLVEHDDHRLAHGEDAVGDEAVTGADALAGAEHEEDRVHIGKGAVDRVLHALGQRVERALEARQVDEHCLPVLTVRRAVGDAEDAPPRGLRLVADDRDLAAAEGIDEGRLADVGPASDRDESAAHQTLKVSGNSAAGVERATLPSARR